jgi:hypothetical protein
MACSGLLTPSVVECLFHSTIFIYWHTWKTTKAHQSGKNIFGLPFVYTFERLHTFGA